jgi:MinD-like ATPase involved in chromosome partitioning or flagellar assembly
MTNTETMPASWPTIAALTREDGSGEVTINGTSHPIETNNIEEARSAILARVVETAAKVQRPVRVTTTGPDGAWPLIVHPDGTVEPDPDVEPTPAPVDAAPESPAEASATPTEHQVPGPPAEAAPAPSTPLYVGPPQPGNEWVRSAPAHAAEEPPQTRRAVRQSFLTQIEIEEPASQGWRGLVSSFGIRMSPGPAERAERADVRLVSQHWPGPRTIAVVNGRGGVGKSMTTISLSATFARYGGSGVLAEDNNQTRGTLGWRTEKGPHDASLLDLLPQIDRLLSPSAQAADLAHYVHHQTRDRYDVLRSRPELLASDQRFDAHTVDAVHAVATKYYRLILIDSGNDESDAMWLRMIHHANQIVVPTTTRRDSAESAALLLDALHERGGDYAKLAQNAVVVVSQENPAVKEAVVAEIAAGFKSLAREVVTIPFDPAMKDGLLTYGSLRPATQRAWLRAGAAVATGL